jgi:hypothetical protein
MREFTDGLVFGQSIPATVCTAAMKNSNQEAIGKSRGLATRGE